MALENAGLIASLVLGGTAVVALAFNVYVLRQNTKVNRANFWLTIREMISKHNDVHLKLRPGGDWGDHKKGPSTHEEWAKVEAYMGLFEHFYFMLQKKLIDLQTFQSIYQYRLSNILQNNVIVEAKLKNEKSAWKNFIDLCKLVGLTNTLTSKKVIE
jgi:hypothetical protein